MNMMNLLTSITEIPVSLIGETFDISLNWIGKLVKLIISSGVGVGFGVILFSLILKVIVLPFDVFQRISMRKQNIKMKENKEKMEKLQKQYANDKKMYNQKVMEMQKQSGFSLMASCLPMILSLVIFFVAIGAFNAYAKFSAVDNYNTLANAYRSEVNEYVVDLDDLNSTVYSVEKVEISTKDGVTTGVAVIRADKDVSAADYDGATDNKIIFARAVVALEEAELALSAEELENTLDQAALQARFLSASNSNQNYYIDVAKASVYETTKAVIEGCTTDEEVETALKTFINQTGANAAEEAYDTKVQQKTKFIWIKNIWQTDASYKHPISSHSDFLSEFSTASCGSCSCGSNGKFIVGSDELTVGSDGKLLKGTDSVTNAYEKTTYDLVTANLSTEKDQANGYFILIVLSIATIILQQWITQRSQKEQQKYSSVDGQSASQQKIMMITMTLMFGVFSFMYSAAFSIYMITSNIFSLGSTLIINKCVDVAANKKEQKALQAKYDKRLPRTGTTITYTNTKKSGKKDKKDKSASTDDGKDEKRK